MAHVQSQTPLAELIDAVHKGGVNGPEAQFVRGKYEHDSEFREAAEIYTELYRRPPPVQAPPLMSGFDGSFDLASAALGALVGALTAIAALRLNLLAS